MSITRSLRFLIFSLVLLCSNFLHSEELVTDWKDQVNLQRELRISDADKSIQIGLQIIEQCDNDSIRVHSYAILGIAYANIGDYLNAFRACKKAQENLFKYKIDFDYYIFNSITLIETYKTLGLLDRSVTEVKSTFELIKKKAPANNYLTGIMHGVYANVLLEQKKYNETLFHYSEALNYINKVDDPDQQEFKAVFIAQINSETANIYILYNDYKTAEIYANKAKDLIKDSDNFQYVFFINTIRLGTIYYNTDRKDEAIAILEPLKNDRNISPLFQQDIQKNLYEIYKEKGEFEKQEEAKKALDSLAIFMANNQSTAMNEIVNQVENELGQKEKEKLSLIYLYTSLILVFIGLMVYGLLTYKKKLRNERKKYEAIIHKFESASNRVIETESQSASDNIKETEIESTFNNVKATRPKQTEENVGYSSIELQLLEKVKKFVAKKKYLKKDITLASLAVEFNTNPSYLSDIINKSAKKNFNSFINELRIDYITKELYCNAELLNYKISYLADISGFNSHNTFTLVFKKINAISPSIFIQQRKIDHQQKTAVDKS